MKIVIFGGSGFIGRSLVRALAHVAPTEGLSEIIVVSRTRAFETTLSSLLAQAGPLSARGRVIVCDLIEKGPTEELADALKEASHVFYSLQFPGHPVQDSARGYTYARYDLGGLRKLLEGPLSKLAKQAHPSRIIYLSGAGAGQGRPQPWFTAKDAAEAALAAWSESTGGSFLSLRPSVVVGAQDVSLNKVFRAAKLTRTCPLFGSGDTLLHPIWVEDLARALVALGIQSPLSGAYNLPGPQALTFKETLRTMFDAAGLRPAPVFVPVPIGLAKAGASLLSLLPRPPLTPEAIDFLTTGPEMPLPEPGPALDAIEAQRAYFSAPAKVFESYL